MEEILNTMRATQAKKNALGKARAMEIQMEHPQTMDNTQLEPTTDDVIHGKGSGGEAGMRRVIGNGKRGRPSKVTGTSNGTMVGGAMQLGSKLAEQILSLHGKDFADQFHQGVMNKLQGGVMSGAGKKCGGAAPISAPPSGLQVSHAIMSPAQSGLAGQALGGQDVPPGGIAPRAYGSVPQAPASFARNTVGMGKVAGGAKQTKKDKEDEKLAMEIKGIKNVVARAVSPPPAQSVKSFLERPPPNIKVQNTETKKQGPQKKGGSGCPCEGGAKKKSSVRGQMISKLMKEKGMTLGQASKYLKENS